MRAAEVREQADGIARAELVALAENRVDLLIKAPLLPAAYPVLVQHAVGPGDLTSAYPVPLVSARIKAGQQPVTGHQSEFIPNAPDLPKFLEDIAESDVKGTKQLDFASTPPIASHTINNEKFDGYQNAKQVFINTVEEWKITNATTSISHPFHIHINPFQISELFNPNDTVPDPSSTTDKPKKPLPKYIFYPSSNLAPGQCILNPNDPTSWKPCEPPDAGPLIWWDVFPIPAAIIATDEQGNSIPGPPDKDGKPTNIVVPGYFKMRSRFVDYPGYYVLHCHILAHEDRGMMATVQVCPSTGCAPAPAPFAHH